ncbi:MAG: hypothetical protein PHC61_14030 [Chitinivibrionales bacterium]|nr:hypothetical protein [Chitinivibrionales bacterium]
MHEQLELPLFPPIGFKALLDQKGVAHLSIKINPRLKRSWRVRLDRFKGCYELFIPPCCADAPEEIKAALIDWVLLACKKKSRNTRRIKRALEEQIAEYIRLQNGPWHGRVFDREKVEGKTLGCKYDLALLLGHINATYFSDEIKALIRWGSPRSKTSFLSLRRDNHDNRLNLITIAGIYNHPDVPRYAIEGVIFHEMAHIKSAPFKRAGRNIIHGREFKALERSYPHYRQWAFWEKHDLPKLCRNDRKKAKNRFVFF